LRWDIPTFGTMAHSYVECFEEEQEAFRAFARLFPNSSTFLVDTYDTIQGVRATIAVAREMRAAGAAPPGIRLDSGNLDELSRMARALLDEAGLGDVQIFASGGLDEYSVDELVRAGAPIDAFGIGTSMGVSADAPYLDCAYKLVEYAHRGRLKLSSGKTSWIGRKQVWRALDGDRMTGDCLALREETPRQITSALDVPSDRVEPLLRQVMQAGKVVVPPPTLAEIRDRFRAQFAALDATHKELRKPAKYPVTISTHLATAQREAEAAIRAHMR